MRATAPGRRHRPRPTSSSTPAPPSSRPTRPTTTRPTSGEDEVGPTTRRKKIMILGGGPNRIGQGIEFDYCCVHAVLRAARAGLRDDHGQLQPRDRLHRLRHLRQALLRAADARGRAQHRRRSEKPHGVIVQFGGQTPLNLAVPLERRPACRSSAPRPTASTSPRTASASPRCSTSSAIPQPANGTAHRRCDEALERRRTDRLPGARAPLLRARRPRHADRLRRRRARAATSREAVEAAAGSARC